MPYLSPEEFQQWLENLSVGDTVCDCRYKHLKITEIGEEYIPPKWTSLFLANWLPLILFDAFANLRDFITDKWGKFLGWKLWDKTLVLEDRSTCSARACCNPADHSPKHRPAVKRLNLDFWVKYEASKNYDELDYSKFLGGRYPEIPPFFHREGWYLNRETKESWFEVKFHDGKIRAFAETRTEDFEYSFSILNHTPMTNKEMEAVRTIQSYLRAKLPPALSKLLTLEKDRRMRAKIRTRYLRVKLRDYHD